VIDLAETESGFTVTIGRTYVDADRVIIGYTYPRELGYVGVGALVDSTGQAYRQYNAGNAYQGLHLTAVIASFDASPLLGDQVEAAFTLTLEQARRPGSDASAAGPWRFTLRIPILPSRPSD
jgi:hypothetical protein